MYVLTQALLCAERATLVDLSRWRNVAIGPIRPGRAASLCDGVNRFAISINGGRVVARVPDWSSRSNLVVRA